MNIIRFVLFMAVPCLLAGTPVHAGDISIYGGEKGALSITDQENPCRYERTMAQLRQPAISPAEKEALRKSQRPYWEEKEREIQNIKALTEEKERMKRAEEAKRKAKKEKTDTTAPQEAK
ncbi:MAG: hypothetical protein HPY65_02200 [Syntrophaceae bacterium]|nr:hypothetical protein [Syntrophaceae bacterium]